MTARFRRRRRRRRRRCRRHRRRRCRRRRRHHRFQVFWQMFNDIFFVFPSQTWRNETEKIRKKRFGELLKKQKP